MKGSPVNFALRTTARAVQSGVNARDLESLSAYVLVREKVQAPVELAVDLTGHARIQALNRRFRGVDRTTDVIAFRDALVPGPGFVGDIAINVQQAAVQAKGMGHSLRREVRLLLIHGLLHLLGYTDDQSQPRRRMFRRQNELLKRWEKYHP